jgi:hypothetical protein
VLLLPVTVAVNVVEAPVCTDALVGDTVTDTFCGGGVVVDEPPPHPTTARTSKTANNPDSTLKADIKLRTFIKGIPLN